MFILSAKYPDTLPPTNPKHPKYIKMYETLTLTSCSSPSIDASTKLRINPIEEAAFNPKINIKNKKGGNYGEAIKLNTIDIYYFNGGIYLAIDLAYI
jgi:hypothetical protein